jgi:hypothetical protein
VTTPKRPPRLPRIGPCRDPLHLWYLEFEGEHNGRPHPFRRYFANRDEARAALRQLRDNGRARGSESPGSARKS